MKSIVALVAVGFLVAGCSGTVRSGTIGAGLGAGAGCAVGSLWGACGTGAAAGAIAGGTLGAAVGAVNDAPPPRKRK